MLALQSSSLRTLTIFPPAPTLLEFPIKWNSLTTLKLLSPNHKLFSRVTILRILSLTVNLVEIQTLMFWKAQDESPLEVWEKKPILLEKFRCAKLYLQQISMGLGKYLELPAIEELRIVSWAPVPLMEWVKGCGKTVNQVALGVHALTAETKATLRQVFEGLRSVTKLSLTMEPGMVHEPLTQEVMGVLEDTCEEGGGRRWLPNLQELTVALHTSSNRLHEGPLAELVIQRRGKGRVKKLVRVVVGQPMPASLEELQERLFQQGLKMPLDGWELDVEVRAQRLWSLWHETMN